MKNILSLLLLLVVVNVEASLIPEPPSSCFKSKSRCSSVKIVKRAGVKRVAIDLFARVSKEKFSSVDEISQRYLAFENWPKYVRGSGSVKFRTSRTSEISGQFAAHYFDYKIKAPWPVRWARLKGTTVYQPTEVEGAEVSFSFNLDKSQSYDGLTAYDGKIYVVDALRTAISSFSSLKLHQVCRSDYLLRSRISSVLLMLSLAGCFNKISIT